MRRLRVKQGVALTGRNRTNSVGRPTAHAPGGRPARSPAALQTTDDDGRRRQTPTPTTVTSLPPTLCVGGPVIKLK